MRGLISQQGTELYIPDMGVRVSSGGTVNPAQQPTGVVEREVDVNSNLLYLIMDVLEMDRQSRSLHRELQQKLDGILG